ncbi:MAG: type I restriction-modification enzyme R subunit C-terminal domain-containing protein [candidate division WOR-3 bacterium]
MKPEELAKQKIEKLLKDAGWIIQEMNNLNRDAGLGVAVKEFPLKTGFADYLLFINGKAAGIIEAKPEGTTLGGVDFQSDKYIAGFPENVPHHHLPLPFVYESTGTETFFRDLRDPEPCSRRVFAFHTPDGLNEFLSKETTLRARLRNLPPLITKGLRNCQVDAIQGLEQSLFDARPRALIQMASGAGKTFTAISAVYRLLKFADAKRILFLVDRRTLGKQTLQKFQEYETPDDGRKFTEIYNIQHLTTNTIDPVSRVCITTIQRLYSMLKGEPEFDAETEEESILNYAIVSTTPVEVSYNPKIPIETFDFIITDECHRSIYNLWRQVLEYFDAFIIGLTATPSKQTLGFFNQNLVTEYNHEHAVADGVNVGYEVYRIKTAITEQGSKIDAGYYVDKRDKLTRKVRWEMLEDDLEYDATQLDRSVVAKDQIRTIIRTFKEKLFTDIFPGRKEVPKTLIFAKDDSHAEDIVHIVREEFGKGNEFCKKITYKTTGEKPEDLIASFHNSYNPRIAVTVDMIATGTDIKPLECIIFMRDVKSRVYFEQMKGRGTRVINATDLMAVTPDALHKTHFVIIDAVGVCENDKTDSQPLERKRYVAFDKLLIGIAMGVRDEDAISSLAGRLARMEHEIDSKDSEKITQISGGNSLKDLSNRLLDAIDPDKQIEKAKEIFKTESPTDEQIAKASDILIDDACKPFNNPDLRNLLIEIKKKNEQIIDTISKDIVLLTGFDEKAKEAARTVIDTFKKFIEENKNELTALQIIYSKPHSKRFVTYDEIKQLAEAISKPPYFLTTEKLWLAYEQLEKSRVRGAGPQKLLTNIISLIRFAIGESNYLEPFTETVEQRFRTWLNEQEKLGRKFTPEQLDWLTMIKNHIATSLAITIDDFELAPFFEKGGPIKANQVFGKELNTILSELNEVLVA